MTAKPPPEGVNTPGRGSNNATNIPNSFILSPECAKSNQKMFAERLVEKRPFGYNEIEPKGRAKITV